MFVDIPHHAATPFLGNFHGGPEDAGTALDVGVDVGIVVDADNVCPDYVEHLVLHHVQQITVVFFRDGGKTHAPETLFYQPVAFGKIMRLARDGIEHYF